MQCMKICRIYVAVVAATVFATAVCGQEATEGNLVAPRVWQVATGSDSSTTQEQNTSQDQHPTVAGSAENPAEKNGLALPGRHRKQEASSKNTPPVGVSWFGISASFLIVCGLLLGFVWLIRRTMPGSPMVLPGEVVGVLGHAALGPRHVLHLLQVGQKLVLVAVGPQGITTITEITDALEVDRLRGLCEKHRPGSITASFRHILQGGSEEPALQKPRSKTGKAPGSAAI